VHKISPFLWYNDDAEEAAELYVSIFDGNILEKRYCGAGGPSPEGSLQSVTFEIDGREYQAFNGGPGQNFTEAVSLFVSVDTQEELDAAWSKFLEAGGQPLACGWIRDRFGLAWQLVPTILSELMVSPDRDVSERVTKVMLASVKFDIAEIKAAADG
jgi:predicted 3-demethylubiquinone-9 3-methyltransferase (glyoxalase superfamily)